MQLSELVFITIKISFISPQGNYSIFRVSILYLSTTKMYFFWCPSISQLCHRLFDKISVKGSSLSVKRAFVSELRERTFFHLLHLIDLFALLLFFLVIIQWSLSFLKWNTHVNDWQNKYETCGKTNVVRKIWNVRLWYTCKSINWTHWVKIL